MSDTTNLRKLFILQQFESLQTSSEWEKTFARISSTLMNDYCIQKGEKVYEFTELECYLFTDKHPDIITYPRHAHAGDWFFHASGLDLCFESRLSDSFGEGGKTVVTDADAFGGVLLRGLRQVPKLNEVNGTDNESKRLINGPLKCCYELFDRFSALKETPLQDSSAPAAQTEGFFSQYPYLIAKKDLAGYSFLPVDNISACPRWFKFDVQKKYLSLTSHIYKDILPLKPLFPCKETYYSANSEAVNESRFTEYLQAKYRFFRPAVFAKVKSSDYAAMPKEGKIINPSATKVQ